MSTSILKSKLPLSKVRAIVGTALFFCLVGTALAVDPIHWRVTATDKQSKTPIEGALFNFVLTDERTSKVEHKSCSTDAQGTCEVVSAPATRGFFVGGGTDALVTWDTDKYLKKANSHWAPGAEKHLTIELTSKQYAKEQEDEAKRRSAERFKERARLLSLLASAKSKAVLSCATKEACDKTFALTEIFIAQHSDMKLQVMSPSLLQTYNPMETNKIGISAYRVPGKGTASTILIEVACKRDKPEDWDDEECILKETAVTGKFRPFITGLLQS